MKKLLYLINKETGYIVTCKNTNEYVHLSTVLGDDWKKCYVSLVENIEPLIDGRKRCEAVRLWAEANNVGAVRYDRGRDCLYIPDGSDHSTIFISFDNYKAFSKLEDRRLYKIDELCGK